MYQSGQAGQAGHAKQGGQTGKTVRIIFLKPAIERTYVMNNLNLDYISIGPRRYGLNLLNPIDGIEWGNRVLELLGPVLGRLVQTVDLKPLQELDPNKSVPGDLIPVLQPLLGSALSALNELRGKELSELQKAALLRCFTPENEPLGNAAVFNAWFRRYPADLHKLGWLAIFRLVRDFFPDNVIADTAALLKAAGDTVENSSEEQPLS